MPLEWDAENIRADRQKSHGNYQNASCVWMQWMDTQIGSSPMAIIRMPLECDAVNGCVYLQYSVPWQLSECLLSGMSSARMGCMAWQHLACASYQPAFSTCGGLSRAHSSGEATWALNRDRATSGRVTDQEWVRDLQHAVSMVHPEGPSHVVGSIAERLTRPVSGNLSEWSRTTWALQRTGAPVQRPVIF